MATKPPTIFLRFNFSFETIGTFERSLWCCQLLEYESRRKDRDERPRQHLGEVEIERRTLCLKMFACASLIVIAAIGFHVAMSLVRGRMDRHHPVTIASIRPGCLC